MRGRQGIRQQGGRKGPWVGQVSGVAGVGHSLDMARVRFPHPTLQPLELRSHAALTDDTSLTRVHSCLCSLASFSVPTPLPDTLPLFPRFLIRIEEGYPNNPYHCRIHAADVLRTFHVVLNRGRVMAAVCASARAKMGAHDDVVSLASGHEGSIATGAGPEVRIFCS